MIDLIKLLKNAEVYAPACLGKKDVLVIADKVVRIEDEITGYEGLPEVEIFDLTGKKLLPGYIDMHMHITGGGGEQGPASRVPEAMLSQITSCGITTVLGLLGTDGVTRSVENLVAKARALTEEGITAYCLTGAYGMPSPTITGSVEKDIMMVPPIIGTKIAVSDHRSSNPQGEELIAIGSATRRGGMLANVAGLVTMHMGSGVGKLDPLFYALDHSDIPAKNFLPTHMLRTHDLMEEGAKLVRRGGYFDMTAGSTDEDMELGAEKIMEILSWEGMSTDHLTMSSDAFGSQPKFNAQGECIGLTYCSPKYLHLTIKSLVRRGLALEEAIKLLTSTPAEMLGKAGIKGCVDVGADADLLVLDEALDIDSLFAKGKVAIWEKAIVLKGRFE
ncbi:MAG: beta-aspartyl-peptidase [Phascolarctobacterium sp.]|nr:beta-aspartyl-peptidase [Phascolarctobacterium sp.]